MLKGVKVLSFTHFLQGPSAVQMLADLGADVIKIEPPKGAFERDWAGLDAFIEGVSVFFLLGNRNQRSLSINLRTEKGKKIINELVKDVDVVVENYRPGVMKRLGFDYETLREINPRLVYCSCTGYGSDGPYRDRPGQDLLLQAMSGLASLTGGKDAPPTPVGTAAVDQHAAVLAAFGIVSALFNREKTNKGCIVENNLLNAALDLQIEPLVYHLNKGPLWDRSALGSRFHQAPYGIYKTADSWITISLTPVEKLVKVFKSPELNEVNQYEQEVRRLKINEIVAEEFLEKTTEEWFSIFQEYEIWCGPVNNYEEVEKDPQVKWNKVIGEVEHPEIGTVKLLRHPLRYNGEVPEITQYPPRLGEHTRQILQEQGLSESEIESLFEEGVVNHSETANPSV
jgi:crotonobetainyl-CoA:carnitine CoA-transferase CaiB-like acyl-CoA transferase